MTTLHGSTGSEPTLEALRCPQYASALSGKKRGRRSCGQNMKRSGRNGDNLSKTYWVVRRKGKNDRVVKVYIETSLVVQWSMLLMHGLGFNPWSEN